MTNPFISPQHGLDIVGIVWAGVLVFGVGLMIWLGKEPELDPDEDEPPTAPAQETQP